jgi:hypothetical protein
LMLSEEILGRKVICRLYGMLPQEPVLWMVWPPNGRQQGNDRCRPRRVVFITLSLVTFYENDILPFFLGSGSLWFHGYPSSLVKVKLSTRKINIGKDGGKDCLKVVFPPRLPSEDCVPAGHCNLGRTNTQPAKLRHDLLSHTVFFPFIRQMHKWLTFCPTYVSVKSVRILNARFIGLFTANYYTVSTSM